MSTVLSLNDAIQNAKEMKDFSIVLMAVNLHPEWLVEVPEGRKWAILHHIVFSGNVEHLDQLLAVQKINSNFRLLAPAQANETALTVAQMHDAFPKMLERIKRLIKLDEMLNYAKVCHWDECYEIVKVNPSYGNEKPPYRRFYLLHHIACSEDNIQQFERFRGIAKFKFDITLRADRKRVNDIAREMGQEQFARYLETNYAAYFDDEDADEELYEPSKVAQEHTIKVNVLMEQRNVFSESDLFHDTTKKVITRHNLEELSRKKSTIQLEEQQKKGATSNGASAGEHPMELIRKLLTCSLTHAIVTDPVVAADGFTYERSAIENWLKTHDYSPMTNEKLAHKNVNPNIVVKQILNSITQK